MILNILPHSHSMTSVPSAHSFWSSDGEEEEDVIDVCKVKKVSRLASFRFKVSGMMMTRMVFGLPALINHSCLPNSVLLLVGSRSLFIRAAKQLKTGEELSVSYVDCLTPLAWRREKLKRLGFSCCCERCEVESRYQGALSRVPKLTRMARSEEEMIEAMVGMFGVLEKALEGLAMASEVEKAMIRAGYVEEHSVAFANQGEPEFKRICRRFKPMSRSE